MSLLFLAKQGDAFANRAWERLRADFPGAARLECSRASRPDFASLADWQGSHVVSYLFPWVVPGWLLARAAVAAINFHPGPPEYPGIGCTNFALYNEESVFGVTCHHMAPVVDSGEIIAVRRFPLLPEDSVLSLTRRCYEQLFGLFEEVAPVLARGGQLPRATETWTRAPYLRRELDALCRLECGMDEREMARRIRATVYPGMPGPYVVLAGRRFVLENGADGASEASGT